ncbi:MAG TPA: hypothetical protein VHO66_03020, partial [Ruminiclostridium sp.]|nr:hypothetical protein [Ruminiclostridium sp.]
MSFPNIPNITPCITITLEDAVNLLLTSIALEEISLSKLMNAEKDKIEFVIGDCKHKDSKLHDSVVINKSVNETIQNLIKLQMLLQFKLEHVKEIIPCSTTTCSTTTTSTTTTTSCTRTTTTASKTTTTTSCTRTTTTVSRSTTCSHTTTCTSCTYTTTTSCPCVCCLRGKGRGGVTNT